MYSTKKDIEKASLALYVIEAYFASNERIECARCAISLFFLLLLLEKVEEKNHKQQDIIPPPVVDVISSI